MLFPEELDNRSLRLLVDRTLTRRKEKNTLSKIEQDINDIINEFPELGFQDNNSIDLYAHFKESENNPFLLLSAIWEVKKQLDADSPKGIRKVVYDYFNSNKPKADDIFLVADTYLTLYLQQQEEAAILSEKEYLWEMYYALNQSGAPLPKSKNKKEPEAVPPGLIGDAFSAIARELHDEASFIKIDSNNPAEINLADLPIEWINAMSSFWQLPEHDLKRDNIREIVTFFKSPDFQKELPQKLSREDRECLTYILENDNNVSYSEASKRFGPEQNDGYWWTMDVPKSTLGNLRMMGLLIVGEVHSDNTAMRMAMLPKEIVPAIKKVLK